MKSLCAEQLCLLWLVAPPPPRNFHRVTGGEPVRPVYKWGTGTLAWTAINYSRAGTKVHRANHFPTALI